MFKAEKIESIYKTVLSQNSFEIHLDRYVAIGGYQYDRLLSKWAIFKGGVEKMSKYLMLVMWGQMEFM